MGSGVLKTGLVVPLWCQNPGARSETLDNNGWEMVEAAGIEPAPENPGTAPKPLEDKGSRDAP